MYKYVYSEISVICFDHWINPKTKEYSDKFWSFPIPVPIDTINCIYRRYVSTSTAQLQGATLEISERKLSNLGLENLINAISHEEPYFVLITSSPSQLNDLFISRIAGCFSFCPTWNRDVSFGTRSVWVDLMNH